MESNMPHALYPCYPLNVTRSLPCHSHLKDAEEQAAVPKGYTSVCEDVLHPQPGTDRKAQTATAQGKGVSKERPATCPPEGFSRDILHSPPAPLRFHCSRHAHRHPKTLTVWV